MTRIEDNSINLVIADFPYGKNIQYDNFIDTKENVKRLIRRVMPEILRVGKFVMITCGTDMTHLYPEPSDMFAIFQPANASFSGYGHITWQPILVYGNDPQTELKRKWMTIINTEVAKSNSHPCPKPIKLWEKIIYRGTTNQLELVYDPFMGSGTTAVACVKLGRNFIGSEISAEYVALANRRIDEIRNQGCLFSPSEI